MAKVVFGPLRLPVSIVTVLGLGSPLRLARLRVDPRHKRDRSFRITPVRERKAKWGTAPGRGLPRAPGPVKNS